MRGHSKREALLNCRRVQRVVIKANHSLLGSLVVLTFAGLAVRSMVIELMNHEARINTSLLTFVAILCTSQMFGMEA